VLLLVEMDDDDGGAEAMLMCALDCPRAAAEAAWGTIFSPLGETRVTDLYLLDSPAGARWSCIWSHLGKPDAPAHCPTLI
jgi:hypothetical protein